MIGERRFNSEAGATEIHELHMWECVFGLAAGENERVVEQCCALISFAAMRSSTYNSNTDIDDVCHCSAVLLHGGDNCHRP